MQSKRTILTLEEGNERAIFPSPHMYKVQLDKGAQVLLLEKTPSGHLAIPCSSYKGGHPRNRGRVSN
eukprot:5119938-Pyramimonas_sp.AAC.2